jgi:hypothetical protein
MIQRCLIISVVLAIAASAQTQTETTRQLWNDDFLQKRPVGATHSATKHRIEYVPVSQPSVKAAESGVTIGFTLWRLRPASSSDQGARLLVLEPAGEPPQARVPERVKSDTILSQGDRVRLSIEAPLGGYLYVIDREEYADHTFSDPYLIYPNWQTRTGDNVVAPGRLIEIPDQRDNPNCFTMKSTRPNQTAELISLLIAPEAIPGLQAGRSALKLAPERFAAWEKKWGVTGTRFELKNGAGVPWTDKEKAAGANPGIVLTQEDAMPQTLYRVPAKSGNPLLVTLLLRLQ